MHRRSAAASWPARRRSGSRSDSRSSWMRRSPPNTWSRTDPRSGFERSERPSKPRAAVTFAVDSDSLGLHVAGLSANAFETETVPLPKLTARDARGHDHGDDRRRRLGTARRHDPDVHRRRRRGWPGPGPSTSSRPRPRTSRAATAGSRSSCPTPAPADTCRCCSVSRTSIRPDSRAPSPPRSPAPL